SQTRTLSTLVDMAFDASDAYRTVAASAFGSLYYFDKRENIWRDLTPFLPQPATEISSVAIAHDGVAVGFEGRSVWRIEWPELAPIATFFAPGARSAFVPGARPTLGTLMSAAGNPIPGTTVSVVIPATASQSAVSVNVQTTSLGAVPLP